MKNLEEFEEGGEIWGERTLDIIMIEAV